MKKFKFCKPQSTALLFILLAGCGGVGSTQQPTKVSLAGEVAFPSTIGTAKRVEATATAITLEIHDLNGTMITALQLTPKSGTSNIYSYSTILNLGKDYVLVAKRGNQILRTLMDKTSLALAAPSGNVNQITTTSLIIIEQKLSLTPGTLGRNPPARGVAAVSDGIASNVQGICARLVAAAITESE